MLLETASFCLVFQVTDELSCQIADYAIISYGYKDLLSFISCACALLRFALYCREFITTVYVP